MNRRWLTPNGFAYEPASAAKAQVAAVLLARHARLALPQVGLDPGIGEAEQDDREVR